MLSAMRCTRPAVRSAIATTAALKGTWTICVPVSNLNSSMPTWMLEPLPVEAYSSLSGFFFAYAISFDVKNGIARKQASDDADLQIDDYILGSTESYQARLPGNPPKTASAPAAPAPTPASSPK